ncbi:hypothetical protein G6F65_023109 [Rhizopus arrhizus]|nr:hypothetical protein G6F65_023109 [Rhizopus arrhizus]
MPLSRIQHRVDNHWCAEVGNPDHDHNPQQNHGEHGGQQRRGKNASQLGVQPNEARHVTQAARKDLLVLALQRHKFRDFLWRKRAV